jgi:hypothetical protein
VSLIQFVNVFLMHSWLASATPFTPIQNANLAVAISSCASPDLLPISEMAKTCSNPWTASTAHHEAMSFDLGR